MKLEMIGEAFAPPIRHKGGQYFYNTFTRPIYLARMKEISTLTWLIKEQGWETGDCDRLEGERSIDCSEEMAKYHGLEAGYRFRLHELYSEAIS
jgi:hypothetical protein